MMDPELTRAADQQVKMEIGVDETSSNSFEVIPGLVSHDSEKQNAASSSSNSTAADHVDGKGGSSKHKAKDDEKDHNKQSLPLYRLFSFADTTDILLMILGTAGAVLNGATMPLITVLLGNMTQAFGEHSDADHVVHQVSKVCLQYVYLGTAAAIASFLQLTCWMVTGERQAARIRKLYLNSLLNQEVAFFDNDINTGEVVGRMSGDTILIQEAMGEKAGMLIQLISTFFTGYTVAFIGGWQLTLVMVSMIPLVVLCGAIVSKMTLKIALHAQEANTEISAIVQQTVSSIRTVASFTGEKLSEQNVEKVLRNAYKSSIQEGVATGSGSSVVKFLGAFAFALGFWYGAKLILDKSYTGGDVLNIVFAIVIGSTSFGDVSSCITTFAAGRVAAYKVFETINRKPEINVSDKTGRKLDVVHGHIEFKDIYFSYASRPQEKIFTGLSLSIHSGTTVALVGGSGSGKSTVISLIERFYDPQDGEVLIDGINIKQFNLRWLRQKIGLVSQEPVLFATTIRDNIAYGKYDATDEEINAAAHLANASKFIKMLPQGLETMVGEHGTQLSGGQKQRIAIARAILKDPRILLMDEATSALDVESERVVQGALDGVMTNRTTVVVAHRLITVRNANCIVVMHQGSITEKGTHLELLENPNGAYSQLIQLQQTSRNLDESSETEQDHDRHLAAVASDLSRNMPSRHSLDRTSSSSCSSRFPFSFGRISHIEDDLQGSALEQPKANVPSNQSKQVPLSRLAYLNKPEIPILILGSVAAVVTGLRSPLTALVLSKFVGIFYEPPEKLKKNSITWSAAFVAFAAVDLVVTPIKSYLFAVAGAKLIRRIRLMAFHKVVNTEIAWFDDKENSSGAIGARLSTEAATLKSLVGDSLAAHVQNITTLIGGLSLAFVASWQLSLIVMALLPLIGLSGWMGKKLKIGFGADLKMMYEEAMHVANDALRSIRTVASFSAEEKVMQLFNKKCEEPISAGIRQGLISGVTFAFSFSLIFLINATAFYAGARLVGSGKVTFENVYQAFFAILITAREVSQSRSAQPDLDKARSVITSIFASIDRKSKIDPSDDSGLTSEMIEGNITFHHVGFKYPTRPDVQIFHDICLSIQSGKVIAFVGESGSGKSTVIALLQRFYDPDSGHILLDGTEIQKFQLRWLRQQMGLVSQEPTLFKETIHVNIAYGKQGKATEAEIIAAAKLANAHQFISSLNQGYQTMVGERGIQLSGGQKQRIAIARAIVKEPKILLLDEATSALDTESERVVQDALNQVMLNRTSIIVAHRLSTIKNADLIAVIKNGVIVEQGKHDTLIDIRDGVYASLAALHSSAS